jgi:hypothetical protein
MDLQQLSVEQIVFLSSGKLSVEVRANSKADPPKPPGIDNISMRVYMEYLPTDTMETILRTAIETADAGLRGP